MTLFTRLMCDVDRTYLGRMHAGIRFAQRRCLCFEVIFPASLCSLQLTLLTVLHNANQQFFVGRQEGGGLHVDAAQRA